MGKEVRNIKSTILELIGIFCIVFTVATFILPTHVLANDNSSLHGDVNGDGVVNILDFIALKLVLLGQETPAGNADVDGNGVINTLDLAALLDLLLGKSSSHAGGGGGGGGGAAITNQVSFNSSNYKSSYGPSGPTFTAGQMFTARVEIAQTSYLYNGSFTIDYNSSILKVDDVNNGLFATTCVINMTPVVNWTNGGGQLTVLPDLSSCATNGSGVSGSGYFCDIQFETVGAGTSLLTFGNSSLYQSQTGNISAITGTTWINSSAQVSQLYSLNATSDDHGNVTTPGEAGPYTYSAGHVVNLVATPDTCYNFVNWTGSTGTIANPNAATTTITMNGDYAIQANFAMATYTLALIASPGAGGSPLLDGGNPFDCGTNATIHANTDPCYTFSGWSPTAGVANPSAEDTTVTMSQNRSLTASYLQKQNTLTIGLASNGHTNLSVGAHTYGCGNAVSITSTPDSCYRLDYWGSSNSSINGTTGNPLIFNIYGNTTVTPYFVSSASYTLSLTAAPLEGGIPTANRSNPIDCGGRVALSANPSACYNFSYWEVTSGSLVINTPNASNITITMLDDYSITAHYTIKRYTLTTAVSPSGAGTVNGTGSYDCNTSAQVTANAIGPYVFNYWSGGGINGSTNNPENVTMNSAKTVTAVFKTNPNTVYCENVSTKTHNTSFTLKVMALNITPNVYGGTFDLRYNSSIMSVYYNASSGRYNVSSGLIGGTPVPMASDSVIVMNVSGENQIVRIIVDQSDAASGSGYFCQITFNATAVGTSALEFVEGDGSPPGVLSLSDYAFPPNELDVTWINGSVRVQ